MQNLSTFGDYLFLIYNIDNIRLTLFSRYLALSPTPLFVLFNNLIMFRLVFYRVAII